MRSKLVYVWAGILIGLSGIISLYHLAYLNKIYPYVSVGLVNISNLTLDQAEKRLASFSPSKIPVIKLTFGNQEWPINLAETQIKYDPKATAEEAFLRGRGQGIVKDSTVKWQQWFKPKNLTMNYSVDEQKLQELIDVVTQAVEEKPIMPALTLNNDGKISLVPGKNGRLVEKDILEQTILNQIGRLNFNNVAIPIKLITIDVSGEELSQAQIKAEAIKDKTLTLKYADFSREIKGQELINLISWHNDWDEEKITEIINSLGQDINREAQNAMFQFANNRVTEFKPALPGLKVNEAETRKRIIDSLNTWQPVEVAVETEEPKIKTEQANDLGIKELIGKGESYFYHSIPGRIHNIALTAAKLNGVLVAPGETFSFNQTVGDISAATGYEAAYIIKEGRTVLGDGGGVCQDSTTLFRAVLNAGLEIVERRAHAYRVGYYENNSAPGFDATVFAPSPDFKFTNDTGAYVLIQTTTDTEKLYLKMELYGTNDGRTVTISNIRLWDQTPPPQPLYQDDPTLPAGQVKQVDFAAWGAKAAFDWKVARNGETLRQKTFYSVYQPWQAVYLRGTKI
ncbi:MAG: VanW family protein [Candidatus Beckwithbacteria bacterium]|nr:VanW family protein [Candidatus Beckwithbacteria bacterium]